MEPLYRTAVLLPHVRLLLVAKVCACLSAFGEDRTGEVTAALSASYTLLFCMVNSALNLHVSCLARQPAIKL
jgi:hypothetical protein